MLKEPEINIYRRTNFDKAIAEKNGHIPIVWTDDPKFGFRNFEDCFNYYSIHSRYDPKMSPHKKFVFDKEQYYDLGGEFLKTGPWSGNGDE